MLVEPENPGDLAQGLRKLLQDGTLRKELGSKGREVVWREFNADVMVERVVWGLLAYAVVMMSARFTTRTCAVVIRDSKQCTCHQLRRSDRWSCAAILPL